MPSSLPEKQSQIFTVFLKESCTFDLRDKKVYPANFHFASSPKNGFFPMESFEGTTVRRASQYDARRHSPNGQAAYFTRLSQVFLKVIARHFTRT